MQEPADLDDFLRWSAYCCPARSGEGYADWLLRAWAEFRETFPPDNQPAWTGHAGYGLKPGPVVQ